MREGAAPFGGIGLGDAARLASALVLLASTPMWQATAQDGEMAMNRPLIDLRTAQLRSEHTEEDIQFLIKETRLASFDCICQEFGWPNYRWSEIVSLVWDRELTSDDYHEMIAHPRDLDLTGEAYQRAAGEVLGRVEDGLLECSAARDDRGLRAAIEERFRAYQEQGHGG